MLCIVLSLQKEKKQCIDINFQIEKCVLTFLNLFNIIPSFAGKFQYTPLFKGEIIQFSICNNIIYNYIFYLGTTYNRHGCSLDYTSNARCINDVRVHSIQYVTNTNILLIIIVFTLHCRLWYSGDGVRIQNIIFPPPISYRYAYLCIFINI